MSAKSIIFSSTKQCLWRNIGSLTPCPCCYRRSPPASSASPPAPLAWRSPLARQSWAASWGLAVGLGLLLGLVIGGASGFGVGVCVVPGHHIILEVGLVYKLRDDLGLSHGLLDELSFDQLSQSQL